MYPISVTKKLKLNFRFEEFNMNVIRRSNYLACICFCASLTLMINGVQAGECTQDLKDKNVSIVVHTGPGGGYDLMARLIAPKFEQISGAARVTIRNLPGGRGTIASQYLLEPHPSEIKLGYFDINAIAEDQEADVKDKFTPLVGVVDQWGAWIARSDYELPNGPDAKVIIGSYSSTDATIAVAGIVPDLLDLKPEYLLGITDQSQVVGAILRKEMDISRVSVSSAVRAVKSGDLKIALALSSSPLKEFPSAPFLGGENGLVAKRSQNLPPEERKKRLNLAEQVLDVARLIRSIHAPADLPEQTKICVEQFMLRVLNDDVFLAEAGKADFDIQPKSRAELDEIYKSQIRNVAAIRQLIDEKRKLILGQ